MAETDHEETILDYIECPEPWQYVPPSSTGEGRQLLKLDKRCFVTGFPVADLCVVYLIPPPRRRNAREVEQYQAFETLATRQKFAGNQQTFKLKSPTNAIFLNATLARTLEEFNVYCITVPLADLIALKGQLERDNAEWAQRAEQDSSAERILGSSNARLHSYDIKTLAILNFSPQFLPQGSTLVILGNESRYLEPGGKNTPGTHYAYNPSGLLCEIPYPPTLRNDAEKLSLFALIVRAESKLSTLIPTAGHSFFDISIVVTDLIAEHQRVCAELVREIFYTPPGLA
ncbi:uncharacterized protein SCHCODRAFT_02621441 [Schizophyllum commune H4-8]|uniref:uncharacterized protein n=1 Tax=Schizophyllum commune (strain H4-8 / FGSC 9210) TaxID=578458 RepID=UPI002160F239|nr:uncharacterized protein SCHCODRAFT_02621441 [Schizophyllum commune H4-8]KAI5893312.1 hypothetical protein SCHCODRAFT_02621441 [Schizophyllum commune H4-8]